MVQAINGAQNSYNFFQVKPVNEREAGGAGAIRGGSNFFVNPGSEITSFYGEYGVGITHAFSATTNIDGSRVISGIDGEGLAHRNANEYGFHAIG